MSLTFDSDCSLPVLVSLAHRNFTDHVNHLQKVKDSMDLWIEAFDTFGAATLMLSESFKGFFAFKPSADFDNEHPTSSPYLPVATTFSEIARKLNRTILPSVRQLFEIRCLQPLAAILALIGPIDSLLQERKSILLDFDSYRAKIEKEHAAGRDSRHPLVIKKAMKLDEVAKHLHSVNTTICALFEEFEKARSVTLGPEFSAFMACFFHFSSYSTELSGKVVPHLPQIASSLYVLESFIGQSFADLYTLEGKSTLPASAAPAAPVPAPASTPQNKFVKSSASTESPSVVLERTEFAGGSYGGYGSHSTVLPARYKDEVIELKLADAGIAAAAAAALAKEEASTTATVASASSAAEPIDADSAKDSVADTNEEPSEKGAEQVPQEPLKEVEMESKASKDGADTAAAIAAEVALVVTISESLISGESSSTFFSQPAETGDSSPSLGLCDPSLVTTEPMPSAMEPAEESPVPFYTPLATPSSSVPPKPSASAKPPPPSPAAAVNTPEPPPPSAPTSSPAAPARTGFFSSFFSSPARTPLPVAKPVTPKEAGFSNDGVAGTVDDDDADVPMVEATIDGKPPKPQKPAELRGCSVDYSRSNSPLPGGLQTPPPPSTSQDTPSGSNSPNPAFRNTIALARGSVEGNLSPDLAERRPLEPGQKPLKPPKPASSSSLLRTNSNADETSDPEGPSVVPTGEATPVVATVSARSELLSEDEDVTSFADTVDALTTEES